MAINAKNYIQSEEACKTAGVTYPTLKRCLENKELLEKVPKGEEPRFVRGVAGSKGGRRAFWHVKFVAAVRDLFGTFA